MSRVDTRLRLQHMLDSAREAVEFSRGKTLDDIQNDRLLSLALLRLLEVIGEAAAQIPAKERAKFPDIPWTGPIGLRNRLIHAYHRVDLAILYDILDNDLPPMILALERALRSYPSP